MTVKSLIGLLSKEDPDKVVVLSLDGEGNEFSPLSKEYGDGYCVQSNTWSCEAYYGLDSAEQHKEWFDIDVEDEEYQKAIILFPIN